MIGRAKRAAVIVMTLCALLAAPTVSAAAPATGPTQPIAPPGWIRLQGDDPFAATPQGHAAAAEGPYAIQSASNNLFAAAELNYPAPYTGLLRARSTDFEGGWDQYTFHWDTETETYALLCVGNGLYVTVENNYTGADNGLLRARSATLGGWQRFNVYWNPDTGLYTLQAVINGLYVTMENNYTGTTQYALRARSETVTGSWEQFNITTW